MHLNNTGADQFDDAGEESLFTLQTMVEFDWKVALGNEEISEEEFRKLVKSNQPLIEYQGQWVHFNQNDTKKFLDFLSNRKQKRVLLLAEIIRYNLSHMATPEGFNVIDVQADNQLKEYLDQLNQYQTITITEPPDTFQGELRPYQKKGLGWLLFLEQLGFGACLADDMGLGKTIEIIALLLADKFNAKQNDHSSHKIQQSSLLICPMSIIDNWKRELERFSPTLQFLIHHGTDRMDQKPFTDQAKNYDLIITTFALAHRDFSVLNSYTWHFLILDEAQNIKNHNTKQFHAINALTAQHRIALTGTPIENRLSELWSIMEFLNSGYLGSINDFHRNFEIPIMKGKNATQQEILRKLIQPFVLRRLKTDKTIIQDLPEKIELKDHITSI